MNTKTNVMELLSYPKNEYLLEASLESLHGEAMAWLNELAYWQDEMAFYYKLLRRKQKPTDFPTEDVADMEKELVRLTSAKLDRLRATVTEHERSLAVLTKVHSNSGEDAYRNAHRRLLGNMHDLHLDLRAFKKKVFSFVQKD